MTLMEFSIACKLINLKLRGFEVPKQIPPTLLCSLTTAGGTPIMTPPGQMSPLIFNRPMVQHLAQPLPQAQQPIIPVQPLVPPMVPPMTQPILAAAGPPPIPPQPIIPVQSMISPPAIPPQPMNIPPAIPPQPMHIPAQPAAVAPILPAALTSPIQATAAAPVAVAPFIKQPSGGNLLDSLETKNDLTLLTNGAAPKPPSQPGTRSGSISETTSIPYEAK